MYFKIHTPTGLCSCSVGHILLGTVRKCAAASGQMMSSVGRYTDCTYKHFCLTSPVGCHNISDSVATPADKPWVSVTTTALQLATVTVSDTHWGLFGFVFQWNVSRVKVTALSLRTDIFHLSFPLFDLWVHSVSMSNWKCTCGHNCTSLPRTGKGKCESSRVADSEQSKMDHKTGGSVSSL